MSQRFFKYNISTVQSAQFVDITHVVEQSLLESKVKEGIAFVYCPHTTAGITINENADPDVCRDILYALDKAYPQSGNYLHMEGNSHAHVKASSMGSHCSVIISDGRLMLGTWQGIYFCEFDGPRERDVYVKILEG
ncbi:secondary thiamine-phosphate synthase enzyme YjbQ [Xylanivirga thermophila]|uniref:secondary thiamine-phosphate synthase enzyme YjbQ n=1 Tax=Xylanivirga thermophila TaxID=2496273 RepID=UPI00101BB134|nr:secondary thiamine-phosphate synthase enzyme YjbQ [Xylanivirga thermophila]